MEQDWIPTAANPAGSVHDLTHLNATMRRIDLICKLIAPLFISLIISLNSNKIGVLVVGIMSASSWGLEMLSALYVYKRNPSLQAPRQLPPSRPDASSTGLGSRCERGFKQYVQDFKGFFGTNVWIPSLSLSLLHLSALSYGATFMTFLLSAGFGLDTITIARALGSVVEISSTVVTPIGVRVLGKAAGHGTLGVLATHERSELSTDLLSHGEEEEEGETSLEVKTVTGLERLGLWGLCWQLGNLVCSYFFIYFAYVPILRSFEADDCHLRSRRESESRAMSRPKCHTHFKSGSPTSRDRLTQSSLSVPMELTH